MHDIRALIVDQDDTLTRWVGSLSASQMWASTLQKSIVSLVGLGHPDIDFIKSEGFFAWDKEVVTKGICPYEASAKRFSVDDRALFELFNRNAETAGILHDTESAPYLNMLKDRGLLLTDASYDWGLARRDGIGHELEIMSRSCRGKVGLFHTTKSNSHAAWLMAIDRTRAMMDEDLRPEQVLVIDDQGKALAKAAEVGCRVVQCLFGDRSPAPDFYQIPQVGPYAATVFGLRL